MKMPRFPLLQVVIAVNTAITGVLARMHLDDWSGKYTEGYNVGIEFENRKKTLDDIHNACYGWSGNRGFYQDVYYKPWNQSPYTNKLCVNTGNNHVNFEIANLNPNVGFTLNNYDCYVRFSQLVEFYAQGGDIQYAGWYFRIDPNTGHC